LELTEVAAGPAQTQAASYRSGSDYRPPRHSRFEVPVMNRPVLAYSSTAGTFFRLHWLEDLMGSFGYAAPFVPINLAVRILFVMIITAVLMSVSPTILHWWRGSSPPTVVARDTSDPQSAITVTDLNIRSGPGPSEQKIGLAERSSHVRILSCNQAGTWCEIQVLQHGRDKVDQGSSDHGWVSKKYLDLTRD
jgi:hypothetical protein